MLYNTLPLSSTCFEKTSASLRSLTKNMLRYHSTSKKKNPRIGLIRVEYPQSNNINKLCSSSMS